MYYNDYIDYLKMFVDITEKIEEPEEFVWHPSEEIDWLAKMIWIDVLVKNERLDTEQCSIIQDKNHTVIEFVFVEEIECEDSMDNYHIRQTFKYSDAIDWFFFYEKEIEWNPKKYTLEFWIDFD